VCYDAYLLPPDRITQLLSRAGMIVNARLLFEGTKRPQACLLAYKLLELFEPEPSDPLLANRRIHLGWYA
jgi:hypothetical protein